MFYHYIAINVSSLHLLSVFHHYNVSSLLVSVFHHVFDGCLHSHWCLIMILFYSSSFSPTPEVKWEKLSMDGESDIADLMGYGHSLTIQSPDVNDSGLYRCTGSNGVGNSPQAIFNVSVEGKKMKGKKFTLWCIKYCVEHLREVTVLHLSPLTQGITLTFLSKCPISGAPGWITKPENVEITAGSSHSFACEASGHPLPSISWFVNGQPAEEAGTVYTLWYELSVFLTCHDYYFIEYVVTGVMTFCLVRENSSSSSFFIYWHR